MLCGGGAKLSLLVHPLNAEYASVGKAFWVRKYMLILPFLELFICEHVAFGDSSISYENVDKPGITGKVEVV